MVELIKGHESLILWMTGVSVITFVATLLAVPWFIIRLPSDYFSHRRRVKKLWADRHPAVRAILLTIKNLAGYILILMGLIMLLTPGQGLITILIGIIFLDLPGKFHFERWLVTRPAVLRSINWLRRRAGKEPIVL